MLRLLRRTYRERLQMIDEGSAGVIPHQFVKFAKTFNSLMMVNRNDLLQQVMDVRVELIDRGNHTA